MTDTIDDVAAGAAGQEPVEPAFDEQGEAEQLVSQARAKGKELVGADGLLSQLTKRVRRPHWRLSSSSQGPIIFAYQVGIRKLVATASREVNFRGQWMGIEPSLHL